MDNFVDGPLENLTPEQEFRKLEKEFCKTLTDEQKALYKKMMAARNKRLIIFD